MTTLVVLHFLDEPAHLPQPGEKNQKKIVHGCVRQTPASRKPPVTRKKIANEKRWG